MVGDIGINKRIYVQKSQHGNQSSRKKQESGQRAAPPPGDRPQRRRNNHYHERKQVLPPERSVDGPVWINKNQVPRPDQLRKVKPDHSAGEQASIEQGQGK